MALANLLCFNISVKESSQDADIMFPKLLSAPKATVSRKLSEIYVVPYGAPNIQTTGLKNKIKTGTDQV